MVSLVFLFSSLASFAFWVFVCVCFFKQKVCILMDIRPCRWVSGKNIFPWLISKKQEHYFSRLNRVQQHLEVLSYQSLSTKIVNVGWSLMEAVGELLSAKKFLHHISLIQFITPIL